MSMLTVEECELLSDSKYRSYISQVEKALKSFEYTSEWADLISALGKLNKVLLNHLKYPVIPKKVTIGKRLAQCLHPALPSGVHLKALEAYDIIFKCIGPQRLAQDLFVYSAGLFPVIAHAAMSVKPVLLTVYEKHFVPLGRQIKPGLNGLLLGLLPGLEEGAECFDRTNTLLEEFCEAADPPFFYTGLWECVLNCPSVRLPAVTFLLTHFNKRRTMEDQLHMMGLDIDLMVQSLCSALQDSSVLVQRSTLDFLLLAFPMHNGQLTRKDLATVVEAALNVVLRRDMSLNRRLYLWFLGSSAQQAQASALAAETASTSRRPRADSSSTTSEFDLSYFHSHSKDLLVAALKQKLNTAGQDARLGEDGHFAVLKPFRILISLLDKPEIGSVIIEDVLLSVFRSLYREGTRSESDNNNTDSASAAMCGKTLVKDSKHVDELVKTANLLFGSFESYFIWEFIGRLFSGACDRTREACHRKSSVSSECDDVISLIELCHNMELLLDVISLDVYPECTTEHLPDLLHQVITAATGCTEAASDTELTAILSMCSKILSRVQPSMATPTADDGLETDSLFRAPDGTILQAVNDNSSDVNIRAGGGNGGSNDRAESSHAKEGDSAPAENASNQKAEDQSDTVEHDVFPEESGGTETKQVVGESGPEEQSEQQTESSMDDDHDSSAIPEDNKVPDLPSEKQLEKTKSRPITQTTEAKPDSASSPDLPTEQKKDLPSDPPKIPQEKHLPLKATTNPRDKEFILSSHRQKSREDKPREHLGLMQQCLGSFQEFFHCIVTRRFLESEKVCEKCMELLTLSLSEGCKTGDQDSLLDESSVCSADSDAIRAKLNESGSHPKVKPRTCTEEGQAAFVRACRLLVDFASFPLYCADYQTVIDQMYNTEDEGTLPQWLQDLLTCSCYVQSFPLQASAIATMLDLIILTQSVQSETQNKSKDTGRRSVSEGRVSVVILPALLPRHLQHINDNTIFYQVIARELWHHLGMENTEYHHRTAELFYMLHQVTPRAWICEDAIGTALISDDETVRLNAFKKFSVLWHLTRNMKADSSLGHKARTFDRSMFVVLDSLKEESSTAKSLTITWLTQVVQRGDISRVLRPVLLMLLHPDTARISIQHVNVHDPKRVSLSDGDSDYNPEANIYAISSEGGNVIFHVNHNPHTKISRKSTEDLKSMAITVMNQKGGQASTAPVRAHSEAELSYERVNADDVKLRFNPFGSVNSLDKLIFDGFDLPGKRVPPNVTAAKRLDKETCQKEGIFFDGKEEEEPAPELTDQVFANKELTSEEVVAEIMADLWNRVVAQILTNESHSGGDSLRKASVTSSQMCDHDLLNAIETASLEVESSSSSENDLPRATEDRTKKGILTNSGGHGSQSEEGVPEGIHPLHMHLLLYTQPYDYYRTLYALSTIRAMLVQCPRLVVTAMATTSISAIPAPHLARIQTLLARHRKSVFGKNFFGELPAEVLSSYRSNMFLEVVISLCLYCMRGYFPNLMMARLTDDELLGNNLVHSQAAEVLTLLLSELLSIMRDSGRSFVSYISDLLGRCKLQKALLHTLLASVYDARQKPAGGGKKAPSLTEAIIEFNNNGLDRSIKEAFQMTLLRLVLVTIMLEDQITHSVGTLPAQLPPGRASTEWDRVRTSVQYSLTRVRFRATEPIAQQTMFLSGVLSALKQRHLCHLHRHWVGLVTSALPFMGRALTQVVLCVVSQLCRNLEELVADCTAHRPRMTSVPPDHMVMLLEGLTALCHYCLLDSNTHVSIGQPAPAPTSSVTTETASAGHILTNLIHVFNPIGNSRETSPQRDTSPVSPVLEARNNLLSIMPRIMACMATLWKAVSQDRSHTPAHASDIARQKQDGVQKLLIGEPRVVRQHILELLSPLSLLHGTHLLGAFAVAWNDRRHKPAGLTKKSGVLSRPCEDQLLLVELVGAIKVLPMDTLIQTVKAVLKNPPSTELSKHKKSVSLEMNLLQLFFAYVQQHAGSQLLDSWPTLLSLIREVLAMGTQPPSTFILLHILNDFVQKSPSLEEKKAQKELQDITQKVLETVAVIAGTSLEQTTWLRRNYAVKPGRQSELAEVDDPEADLDPDPVETSTQVKEVTAVSQSTDSKYSVQALMLLAELMASVLDVVYSSEEKDKVVPFLTTLLHNVFPYLRHHSVDNMPSFRACSQLLSSVSGYQYSRKAWRKEGLELLLDPSFFQMDLRSLASWRVVTDNLLTHDRTTFKDLMNRVSMTQSGSLNLFSSKEQEFELRSQMLKRLSFAIFCSPLDQYQRNMPEIQERLAESLRLTQIPSVMTQVFLCFRVLILRMSPQHLTSLWPTMITEMVQVFLQIEQELSTDTDEFNQYIRTRSRTQLQRIAALDSSWAHLGNGLNAHNNPSWLTLYLSVCRLLDLCLVMPADAVPQFQLYRWAFIGTAGEENKACSVDTNTPKQKDQPRFTPHIIRLASLLNSRLNRQTPVLRVTEGRPLLTMGQLRSIAELQPFFNTLCLQQSEKSLPTPPAHSKASADPPRVEVLGGLQVPASGLPKSRSAPEKLESRQPQELQLKSCQQYVEELLERDFLEFVS